MPPTWTAHSLTYKLYIYISFTFILASIQSSTLILHMPYSFQYGVGQNRRKLTKGEVETDRLHGPLGVRHVVAFEQSPFLPIDFTMLLHMLDGYIHFFLHTIRSYTNLFFEGFEMTIYFSNLY